VLAKQVLDYLLSDPTAIPQANRANQARENPRIAVARGARGVRGALQDHPRVEGLLRGLQIMLVKAPRLFVGWLAAGRWGPVGSSVGCVLNGQIP